MTCANTCRSLVLEANRHTDHEVVLTPSAVSFHLTLLLPYNERADRPQCSYALSRSMVQLDFDHVLLGLCVFSSAAVQPLGAL